MKLKAARTIASWPGCIVTLAILLAFGLTIARAGNQPAAAPSPAPPEDATADEAPPEELQPHIVIAEHVILWDGEIVTWDEVLARFRKLRPRGPLNPSFHFTNGVHAQEEKNWQYWHDEAFKVYGELFEPAGMTLGSISPRGGRRYDAIRTAADLKPDPALARTGQVTIDGKPAADAQVVVLPLEDDPNVATLGMTLDGKRLRDNFDEEWVASDQAGRFTIHPRAQTYFLAVLHDAGVAVLEAESDDDKFQVPLDPWATLTFSTTGDLPGQTAGLSIRTKDMPPKCPEFTIYEVKTEGQPLSIPVPPGDIVVRRSLSMPDGSSIGLPASRFAIAPGAKQEIAIEAATLQEELQAQELHELLRNRQSGKP